MLETIEWHQASVSLPDADITVMVFAPRSSEPIWLGFFDGTDWYDCSGAKYELIQVVAWAEMPRGPDG